MKNIFLELKKDAASINRKATMITAVVFAGFFLSFVLLNIFLHKPMLVAIQAFLAAWMILCVVFYYFTNCFSVTVYGMLLALSGLLGYYLITGGTDGFHIIYILVVPPVAIYFLKLLYGGIYSVLMGAILCVYFWTPLHGIGYDYNESFVIRFPIVYILVLIACLYINFKIWGSGRKQEELVAAAEQANHAKGDFLANMSHEIRTPMNAIVGMCELILREQDISQTVQEYGFNIQNSGRSLLAIINDILDFSKIESGKMELIEEEFNISSTLNDVINMAVTRAGNKKLEIIVHADPDIPVGLLGDEIRIRQVILNLVSNAIKYTNEGCVAIRVSQTRHEYGINLSVSVKDTGIGITEENIEKLFSSFQQVDTKKNRAVEGTGLGLAITQRLVTQMGGFVNVTSEYGKGSEFRFVLPLKVKNKTPFISVKEAGKLRAAGYVGFKKFTRPEVAREYKTLILELASGLHTKIDLFGTMEELKSAVEGAEEKYTHIFTAREEYLENEDYFRQVSREAEIVLVQDRRDAVEVDGNVQCMYKPFYALSAAAVFNHESILTNIGERRNTNVRFIAPKARVLVVDDNEINLKVASGLMRPYRVQVMTAESAMRAIEMLKSKDFDMVFMDHMMPVTDGVEATQIIRGLEDEYYQKLPIIALTANAVSGVKEIFIEAGMNDFIAKPIELNALDRVLRTYIPKELMETPAQDEEFPHDRRKRKRIPAAGGGENALFDPQTGVAVVGGDADYYLDVLKLFVENGAEKRGRIREFYKAEEWNGYVVDVHALKSSALSAGSKKLSDFCAELELAGKERNIDLVRQKTSELLVMYDEVLELGRKYLEANLTEEKKGTDAMAEAGTLTRIPAEKVEAFAKAICDFCDRLDSDEVEKICDEAAACVCNGIELKPFFEDIRKSAVDFEYDDAKAKALQIAERVLH